jgi:hypothetical protein
VANNYSVIIDADIARSSGMTEHPVSSGSRALLNSISQNGHKAAMCPTLMAEWNKHRSLFARKWLASMIAKKKVNFIKPQSITNDLIVNNLNNLNKEKEIAIAVKDAHLIDGALAVDNIIASNDDIARNVFCELSNSCGDLRTIKWFNAITDRVFVTDYLVSDCFVPQRYYVIVEATG